MNKQRTFVHDMKNLLGIIIGYSTVLLDEIPMGTPNGWISSKFGKRARAPWRCWKSGMAPGPAKKSSD